VFPALSVTDWTVVVASAHPMMTTFRFAAVCGRGYVIVAVAAGDVGCAEFACTKLMVAAGAYV